MRKKIERAIITDEIGNLEASKNISKYWMNFSKEQILAGFDEVMDKIKARPVPDWDKIENN